MSRKSGVHIQALRSRGRTVAAPCGPASRQEQGSPRSTGSTAAVGFAAGLCLVWKMVGGARRARIHNLQRGCITVAVAVRRRVVDDGEGWSAKQGGDGHSRTGGRGGAVFCVELRDRGVGCAIGVAAARASAEPVPPPMGMATTEAKTVSAAGEIDPRPVRPSVVAREAETRATNLPGEAERPSMLIRGSCVLNNEVQ